MAKNAERRNVLIDQVDYQPQLKAKVTADMKVIDGKVAAYCQV